MADTPPQGWYPDPSDEEQLRWWDGARWTDHTHPALAAVQSPGGTATAVAQREPQADASAGGGPWGESGASSPATATPESAAGSGATVPSFGSPSGVGGTEPSGFVQEGPASQADLLGAAAGPSATQPPGASASETVVQPSPAAHAAPGAAATDSGHTAAALPVSTAIRLGPLSLDRRLGLVLGAVLMIALGFAMGRMTAPEAADVFDQAGEATAPATDQGVEAVPTPGSETTDPAGIDPAATDSTGGDPSTAPAGDANATANGTSLEGSQAAMQAARSAQSLVEACGAAAGDGSYNGCNEEGIVADAYDAEQVTLSGLTASADSYEITMTVASGTDKGASFTVTKGPEGIQRTCKPATATGCTNGTWQ